MLQSIRPKRATLLCIGTPDLSCGSARRRRDGGEHGIESLGHRWVREDGVAKNGVGQSAENRRLNRGHDSPRIIRQAAVTGRREEVLRMFGKASQKPGRDLAAPQGLDVRVGMGLRVPPEDLEAGGVGLVGHGFRAGGGLPRESRRPIRVRSAGFLRGAGRGTVRSTLEPNRQRIDGTLTRILPGPLAGHLRRAAPRSGHQQAAPVELSDAAGTRSN